MLDHIAEHDDLALKKQKSEHDMEEDDPAPSEEEKKQLIDFVGQVIGQAYLEKEHRKSRVKSLIELAA